MVGQILCEMMRKHQKCFYKWVKDILSPPQDNRMYLCSYKPTKILTISSYIFGGQKSHNSGIISEKVCFYATVIVIIDQNVWKP